jgi:hypothetical protein
VANSEVMAVVVFILLALAQLPGALGFADVDSRVWAWIMFSFLMAIALAISLNALVNP